MQDADVEDRIAKIADWILAGMRPSQIPSQAAKEGWSVTDDDLLDAVGSAYGILSADAKVDLDREKSKAINRLNFLFTRAIAIQDYKTALSIQKELNGFIARNQEPFVNDE